MRFRDETKVFEKKIGKTTYVITSHVPEKSQESILDSLLRLMCRDLDDMEKHTND